MRVKISLSQCYLVAKVIHTQSLGIQIRVYIDVFFTIQRHWSGKINKKKLEQQ